MNKAEPQLTDTSFISLDGIELPLRSWLPARGPRAVIIALHGFNDYSKFISSPASYWNEHGIAVYAYDQRGFGATADRGRWPGYQIMAQDLRAFIPLVQERHPDVPLYLLGDSMGGAVILAARQSGHPLPGKGVILVAPAVWSRETMPFYQRWALWLGARFFPWLELTGESLDITPSDNKKMLQQLGRDPLVIKKTRVGTLYGLTNLMDKAYNASPAFPQPTLYLYGARDEIIPPLPMADLFRRGINERQSNRERFLVYTTGYHMLLRDLQAEVVWKDILSWIQNPGKNLPSVREKAAHEISRQEDIVRYLTPRQEK